MGSIRALHVETTVVFRGFTTSSVVAPALHSNTMETRRNTPSADAPHTQVEEQDVIYHVLRALARRLGQRQGENTDLRSDDDLPSLASGPSSSENVTHAQPTELSAGSDESIDASAALAGDRSAVIHASSANNTEADTLLIANKNAATSTSPAMASGAKRRRSSSREGDRIHKRHRVCQGDDEVSTGTNDVHEAQPRPSQLDLSANGPTHSLCGGQLACPRAAENNGTQHIESNHGAVNSGRSTGPGVIRGDGRISGKRIADRRRAAAAASLPTRSRALLHARQRLRGQPRSFVKQRGHMWLNLLRQLGREPSMRNEATSRLRGDNLTVTGQIGEGETFRRNRLRLKKWALAALAKRARKEMRICQRLRANNRSVDDIGAVNSRRPAGLDPTEDNIVHAADNAEVRARFDSTAATPAVTRIAATPTVLVPITDIPPAITPTIRTPTVDIPPALARTAVTSTAAILPDTTYHLATQPLANRPAQRQTGGHEHWRESPAINMASNRVAIPRTKMAALERRMFGNDPPENHKDIYGVHESPDQMVFMEEYCDVVRQYPWIMRRRQRLGTREATTNTLLIDRKYYALLRITAARAKAVTNYNLEKELKLWFKASDWKVNASHEVESEDGNLHAIFGVDESAIERAET
ncbi:hypothetical protein H4R27_004106 [Coemansia aciculifera]|nr:hypothetical protein H4R27_004106 [Coemansia aciculifera]